ncbi:MAG: SRPBCC family protein [Nitrospirae bacterium]|nr:SRPBCC family protein [Nitrospirota bacterium]
MAHITRTIKINAPLSKVFEYITTPENWTTYVLSLVEVRDVTDVPVKKGTTFGWTYRMLGINFRGKGTVTDYIKNKKFAMQMEGSFPIKETYIFEGDSESTDLTAIIEYEMPGKVLGVVSKSKVIEKMNAKEAAAVVQRLKDICEARFS